MGLFPKLTAAETKYLGDLVVIDTRFNYPISVFYNDDKFPYSVDPGHFPSVHLGIGLVIAAGTEREWFNHKLETKYLVYLENGNFYACPETDVKTIQSSE